MSGISLASITLDDGQAIDDCWNRIGVQGDRSCPLLAEHIHCRNCEVYSAAATRLLDRYSLAQDYHDRARSAEYAPRACTQSVVVFRLGDEWLGLATRSLVEVAPQQAIHSLPHQRSRALLGVANVRGALVACISLVELLGLDVGLSSPANNRIMPRMLIVAAEGGPVVVPVDEVDGIHALDRQLLDSASTSGTHANARFTRGVLHWKARSLRLLDEHELLAAIARSMT